MLLLVLWRSFSFVVLHCNFGSAVMYICVSVCVWLRGQARVNTSSHGEGAQVRSKELTQHDFFLSLLLLFPHTHYSPLITADCCC